MKNNSENKHYNNALPEGYILDNFEIISILGIGGFGIAYLAKDTYLDEKCVIKEYMPNAFAYRDQTSWTVNASSPKTVGSYQWGLNEFLNEAKTITKCQHHNIVDVLRFFEANNTAYIVMPYIEGNNLNELLKQKTHKILPEAEIKAIVIPLLEGLKTVHAQNIFHRDIKLSNIYIYAHDQTPILIDFGSARFSLGEHSRSLTTILTPGYSPHEQYHRHGKQGAWTDIYSMGAVMYFLISGQKPPESPARVVDDPLIPATKVGKGKYSPSFLAAIDHALAFKESDRPQTVDQWLKEINHIDNSITPKKKGIKKSLPTSVWIIIVFTIIVAITILKIKMGNHKQPSVDQPTSTKTVINDENKVEKVSDSIHEVKVETKTKIETAPKVEKETKLIETQSTTTATSKTPTIDTTPLQQELLKMQAEMRRIEDDKKAAANVVVDYYAAIEKKDINSFMRLWKNQLSTAAIDAKKRFNKGGGACQVLKSEDFKHYSTTQITLSVRVNCDEGKRGKKDYQMDFDLEKVEKTWKVVKLYTG